MRIFQFLAGILGGTALGLLFAKREGKSLRKELLSFHPLQRPNATTFSTGRRYVLIF